MAVSDTPRHFSKRASSFTGRVVVASLILAVFMALGVQISLAQTASQKAGVERPLRNASVVAMSRAGFGDDTIVAKINQAPREELDVSVEALLGLKKKGVSKTVIEAMIKRADRRTKQSGTMPPATEPPVSKDNSTGASNQPACSANFQKDGGFVRGETMRSFRDYPETNTWESAFNGMVRSVTTGGWQISNSNREAGTIVGVANVRNMVEDVRKFLGGEATKLTLNVSLKNRESGGIRVETELLIPAGTLLPDEEAQIVFCRILGPITP